MAELRIGFDWRAMAEERRKWNADPGRISAHQWAMESDNYELWLRTKAMEDPNATSTTMPDAVIYSMARAAFLAGEESSIQH